MAVGYDNNMNINPERMSEISSSIRGIGQRYQEKVDSVFQKITDMNNYWQGQEYDVVKSKFEQSKPVLNELGELVKNTIPTNIDTAVNNYAETQNRIRSMFGN